MIFLMSGSLKTSKVSWQLQVFAVSIRKKEKWRWARPYVQANLKGRCLDVGSGVGTLSILMEQLGGDWEFTETDHAAAEETRHIVRGPVYETDIFDSRLQPNTYNLITVFDVIEHVPDPQRFMQRLRDLLTSDGVIVLTTPADNKSFYFWRRLADTFFGIDKDAHAHQVEGFEKSTLTRLTQDADLAVTRLDSFCFFFTEMVELMYNAAYIIKNRLRQTTRGYNVALSPASAADVSRHTHYLKLLQIIYPLLSAIARLDRLFPFRNGYEWGLVASKRKP